MNERIVKVLVVDGHPIMRRCLFHIISEEGGMEFCGEADGMSQALEKIKLDKPDLVIIDLSLAEGSGIDLIEKIKVFDSDILMLVASMNDESLYAERVLSAGAQGYVCKDVSPETLLEAIHQVLKGKIYLSEHMRDRMLNGLHNANSSSVGQPSIDKLANRELTVFDLLGQGLSNSEISDRLKLSVKTIEAHQANIKKKLGLNSARDLIRKATLWFVHEDKYRTLFENMSQGVFYQRADGSLVDCNPVLLELFGLTRDQFLGKNSMDPNWQVIDENGSVLPGDQHPSMQALRTGKPVHDVIAGVFNPQRKEYVWLSINAFPLFKTGESKPYQVFVTLHDITERKKMEEQQAYLFTPDLLTGLCSRKELEKQIAEETHRAARYDHSFSIFMLDIDQFQQINDTYGHIAGDTILCYLAKTLEESIREVDFAARYGGEEFVILLPETSLSKAKALAERLLDKVTGLRIPLSDGNEVNVTISLGIATFLDHTQSWPTLLEAAEKAMYEAKEAGCNRIKVA